MNENRFKVNAKKAASIYEGTEGADNAKVIDKPIWAGYKE